MTELLTLLTAVAVLVLVAVLVTLLTRIVATLNSISGEPTGYSSRQSYVGKIAFGVRAIEMQTSHLGPEVTQLNAGLTAAAAGLRSIDGHLVQTIENVVRQEGR